MRWPMSDIVLPTSQLVIATSDHGSITRGAPSQHSADVPLASLGS